MLVFLFSVNLNIKQFFQQKQDKDGKSLDEILLFINLGNNQNLTQNNTFTTDISFHLEQQIQNQGTKNLDGNLIILINDNTVPKYY